MGRVNILVTQDKCEGSAGRVTIRYPTEPPILQTTDHNKCVVQLIDKLIAYVFKLHEENLKLTTFHSCCLWPLLLSVH